MYIVETTITEAPVNIADTLEGSVTFTCTATGIPLPNITWSSDSNDSIAATSNMILGNITIQSNLTLSFLQRDDFMNYTCTAVNEFGIDSRTAVLGSKLLVSFVNSICDYILQNQPHEHKSIK